jgi:hypothetical protein
MFLRVFSFLILIVFFTSCDKFSYKKYSKRSAELTLDTIIDFSSVDISPSFKICDSLIDKQQKSDCFRNTIHQKIGAELKKHTFTIQDSINELVQVNLLINTKGKVVLETISSSENIKKQLPKLDSILALSITKLTAVYPAIKRGIPVTTKYKLPIRIQLKE